LEIQDGHQGIIFAKKMTIVPVDHHGDHKVGPIVSILGENISKYRDMPQGRRSAEIIDSKCPSRGIFPTIFSM
jgi:hypothetical protein